MNLNPWEQDMFLANDDNPANLDGSYTDLQCCASIELCKALTVYGASFPFRSSDALTYNIR